MSITFSVDGQTVAKAHRLAQARHEKQTPKSRQ